MKDKIYYLILKRKLHWTGWEFPKGAIEKKEYLVDTVIRELKEETGLKPIFIKNFEISGKYNYEKELPDRKGFKGQTYSLFSVETKKKRVKIDKREHSDYKWLNFKEAQKKLKWPNQKECLRVFNKFLTK